MVQLRRKDDYEAVNLELPLNLHRGKPNLQLYKYEAAKVAYT